MPESQLTEVLDSARQQFLELVSTIRPELHRYCARITGSAIDGEDIVQDVLAKAFYQLSMSTEMPPLRPWLFRAAHNAAIDFCRRYDRAHVEAVDELPESATRQDTPQPDVVRAALSSFLALPVRQRSAVILKDVLGFSLEEIAEALETTVLAVKSALVRGREQLRRQQAESPEPAAEDTAKVRAELDRLHQYASLFNARDWDGLRALLADEVRLDLVSKAARAGKEVGQYFGNYTRLPDVRAVPGLLEGKPALAVHEPAKSPKPKYFILLVWEGAKVSFIRDFRYAEYIGESAEFRAL